MEEVAAVDLGSNSFHLVVARDDHGKLETLDRMRETVRLAAGLTDDGDLDAAARARACECLARFRQRIDGIPAQRVRVVGTNTLRKLRDGDFIVEAERALGHEIDIIPGQEEARLIYGGVTRALAAEPQRRLVVDIGGGSTELILGHGAQPDLMESVEMGCVSFTQRFFADGRVDRRRLQQARLAAQLQLEFLQQRYRSAGWDFAIGSSGSVRGAWHVMQAEGWTDDVITRAALEKLLDRLATVGSIADMRFAALRDDRRPVFAGGVAILAGVFSALELETLHTSREALREGVVYDLLGRLTDRDVRDHAVRTLAQRFGVDAQQAEQVEATVFALLSAVAGIWPLEFATAQHYLRWAAQLHEIGLAIAHDHYARHGQYILENANLDGFSRTDLRVLAALVRLQRGRVDAEVIAGLAPAWGDATRRMAALLRVAVLLHRSRAGLSHLPFSATARRKTLCLRFEPGWLASHPLTHADLKAERAALPGCGLKLEFS